MVITFILGYFLDVSAMYIILGCLATGILCVVFDQWKKRRNNG